MVPEPVVVHSRPRRALNFIKETGKSFGSAVSHRATKIKEYFTKGPEPFVEGFAHDPKIATAIKKSGLQVDDVSFYRANPFGRVDLIKAGRLGDKHRVVDMTPAMERFLAPMGIKSTKTYGLSTELLTKSSLGTRLMMKVIPSGAAVGGASTGTPLFGEAKPVYLNLDLPIGAGNILSTGAHEAVHASKQRSSTFVGWFKRVAQVGLVMTNGPISLLHNVITANNLYNVRGSATVEGHADLMSAYTGGHRDPRAADAHFELAVATSPKDVVDSLPITAPFKLLAVKRKLAAQAGEAAPFLKTFVTGEERAKIDVALAERPAEVALLAKRLKEIHAVYGEENGNEIGTRLVIDYVNRVTAPPDTPRTFFERMRYNYREWKSREEDHQGRWDALRDATVLAQITPWAIGELAGRMQNISPEHAKETAKNIITRDVMTAFDEGRTSFLYHQILNQSSAASKSLASVPHLEDATGFDVMLYPAVSPRNLPEGATAGIKIVDSARVIKTLKERAAKPLSSRSVVENVSSDAFRVAGGFKSRYWAETLVKAGLSKEDLREVSSVVRDNMDPATLARLEALSVKRRTIAEHAEMEALASNELAKVINGSPELRKLIKTRKAERRKASERV